MKTEFQVDIYIALFKLNNNEIIFLIVFYFFYFSKTNSHVKVSRENTAHMQFSRNRRQHKSKAAQLLFSFNALKLLKFLRQS